jgi:hypothetical protein
VVAYTNPDGPDPNEFAPDEYPFIEKANALPNFAGLWFDANQHDIHVAVKSDIQGTIEKLKDGIPRGITVYFELAAYTQAEVCALRDSIFDDRDYLIQHGILLSGGGCGGIAARVEIDISPLNDESLAYMHARYSGPIDYRDGGVSYLLPYDAPEVEELRISAIPSDQDAGVVSCGHRPFPESAMSAAPVDLSSAGPDFDAFRQGLEIYRDLYGDLSGLPWILAEKDDFGATFIARRGDSWMEAPIFAGTGSWAPGIVDYCDPRTLAIGSGSAVWWLNPAFAEPIATDTEIHVFVNEMACSGASSPAGRILPPLASYEPDKLSLTVSVRSVGGAAACPGNPAQPVTIVLPEALGNRTLVGDSKPPY